MKLSLTTTLILGLLALSLSAQDATLSSPGVPGLDLPTPAFRGAWSDDFNRADGPIGGDWTLMNGDIGILSNQGYGAASGNSAIMHNTASDPHDVSTCTVDFFHKVAGTSNLVYTALVAGWASTSTNVFVKIQDNDSDGLYDRVFFYTGLNGSPWSGYSPAYYYDLATPTASGNITLYFTNNGDTANFDVDNGSLVEHFECSGVLNIAGLGTGFGIGTYNQPAFDNWNVNGGSATPSVDIKCNGGDSAVAVPAGTNAKLDFDVVAATAAGTPVDTWIVLITPFGPFCYNGTGPISGWNMGLGFAYFTGPLADMNGTCLDRPLPVGNYVAHLGLDTVPNGRLDLGAVLLHDKVDFRVF